jgi:hypothetical protein
MSKIYIDRDTLKWVEHLKVLDVKFDINKMKLLSNAKYEIDNAELIE